MSYVGFVVDNQDSNGYTYEITATLINTTNNAEGPSKSWTFTTNNYVDTTPTWNNTNFSIGG